MFISRRPSYFRGRRIALTGPVLGIILALALTMGAEQDCDEVKKPQDAPALSADEKRAKENLERLAASREAVMLGTIGELAYFPPRPGLVVEGYGVVVGLGTTGSTEVPEKIKDELVKQIRKDSEKRALIPNPEKWLRNLDRAVVMVRGVIPFGASVGDKFDLMVEALPQTQTISLEGGWLYETTLGMQAFPDAVSTKALGAGPIFLNPFNRPAPAGSQPTGFVRKTPQLRRGKVLGGGRVKKSQLVRLVLVTPSYNRAATIRNRINSRFPGDTLVADAISPSYIEVHIPPEWRNKLDRFLALITHLYVRDDGAYQEMQATKLLAVIQHANPPYADISLIWEGLGRPMLPMLQQLYRSPNKGVAFFAARAGLRTGDTLALDGMTAFAKEPGGRYRDLACIELGDVAENLRPEAAQTLAVVLADPDQRLRIAAYEALLKTGVEGPGLVSQWVDGGEFWLDVVGCPEGISPMIYAWRTKQPRVAVFGPKLNTQPPFFYVSPDESVTLAGEPGQNTIRVTRKVGSQHTPPLVCPAEVPGLVHFLGGAAEAVDKNKPAGATNLAGVSLSYTQVLTVLMQMCQDKMIPARFVLQELTPLPPGMMGIKGPRPEKDSLIPNSQPSDTQPAMQDFESEMGESLPKGADSDLINLHGKDKMQNQPVLQPAEGEK